MTIEISGNELALLYIATGNEDAGKILREAAAAEHKFNEAQGTLRRAQKARGAAR